MYTLESPIVEYIPITLVRQILKKCSYTAWAPYHQLDIHYIEAVQKQLDLS